MVYTAFDKRDIYVLSYSPTLSIVSGINLLLNKYKLYNWTLRELTHGHAGIRNRWQTHTKSLTKQYSAYN